MKKIPLFDNELPARGYDTRTLQPVDYGGNPVPQGTGWSSLDIGRLLAALYNLKSSHPEYTNAVDSMAMDWSYLRVVRDKRLESAFVTKDENQRVSPTGLTSIQTLVKPETHLGYEGYAARAFQLWGFDVDRSAVGGQYKTASVEGFNVPASRIQPDIKGEENQYTVINPFLIYALEFGFDPQMRHLFEPILGAQAERYRKTGRLTAGGTTVSHSAPYVIQNTIIARQQPWATVGDDGALIPDDRIVSTATAFAIHSLSPNDPYAVQLWKATTDLYDPSLGYYEGFFEKTGKPATAFTSSTNSMVLQSLLYMVTDRQPLIRPTTAIDSPWWQAVAQGDSGRGLPTTATQKARFISNGSETFWVTLSNKPIEK
ncbi:MAG: hypothetical protein NVSMB70_05880 [Chamaesiphon sp.]